MVGRMGGDLGANEAFWSSCYLLWLAGRGFSANMAQLVSMAGKAESVLEPMIVGIALTPKLHIRILTALVSPFVHWNSIVPGNWVL